MQSFLKLFFYVLVFCWWLFLGLESQGIAFENFKVREVVLSISYLVPIICCAIGVTVFRGRFSKAMLLLAPFLALWGCQGVGMTFDALAGFDLRVDEECRLESVSHPSSNQTIREYVTDFGAMTSHPTTSKYLETRIFPGIVRIRSL